MAGAIAPEPETIERDTKGGNGEMRENIQTWLSQATAWLAWAPTWAAIVVLIAAAVLAGLTFSAIFVRVLRRLAGKGNTFAQGLLVRVRGVVRLAFVVLASALMLPLATLPPELAALVANVLTVAFVGLAGWVALIVTNAAADLYMRRYDVTAADNLQARKHVTQVRILKRAADTLIVIITVAAALMTFEEVRQYGVSLFASAGAAGLVLGLSARPVLSNLIAGVQIAVTQPIRIEDAVVVEGEWGWIEEITSTYVVIRLWDWRRLIVPLAYFIEKPFQNWTRETSAVIGSVLIHTDYTVPVERVRGKLDEIVKASPLWDGRVVNLQVTDAKERTIELRALVSADTSPKAWDLRCAVREQLIAFLQQEYPHALPRVRAEVDGLDRRAPPAVTAASASA
jgi:small-conductance mechanosensitive channel